MKRCRSLIALVLLLFASSASAEDEKKESSGVQPSDYVALTAVVGTVVIGSIQTVVTMRIAESTKKATLQTSILQSYSAKIADLRYSWISELREHLAEFLGIANRFDRLRSSGVDIDLTHLEDYERFLRTGQRVQLLLAPEADTSHAELELAISGLWKAVANPTDVAVDYATRVVVNKARKVIVGELVSIKQEYAVISSIKGVE